MGKAGREFECEELEAEPEFWKNDARPDVSRCTLRPSDAKTSVMGGSRLLVWVAGTW